MAHPELYVAATRRWNAKHPEAYKANNRKNAARRKGSAINDFTAAQWEQMKVDHGWQCYICHRLCEKLSQDHVIPLSRGGNHTADNIAPACLPCNMRKHAKVA